MDQLDLIKAAQAGDRTSAQELVQMNYQLVFSFILRMVGDRQLALDLTQDVFLKALSRLGTYRARGKFSSWLLSIAANRVRDHWRKSSRQHTTDTDISTLTGEGDFAQVNAERDLVRRALAGLSPPQREVVILRFYHDLPLADIAQITGTNLSTAKSRLRLGLLGLKGLLGGEDNAQ